MVVGTGWWVMMLGAVAVAGYASMALWNPDAIPFIFVERLRVRRVLLHRVMEGIYLTGILVGGVTGLWLAFQTPGGVTSTVGFVMLSSLCLVTGTFALHAALTENFAAHRMGMMRSYALTYAAVSLRLYLGIGGAAGFTFEELYPMTACACWAGNLLFVEWVLLPRYRRGARPTTTRTREPVHA